MNKINKYLKIYLCFGLLLVAASKMSAQQTTNKYNFNRLSNQGDKTLYESRKVTVERKSAAVGDKVADMNYELELVKDSKTGKISNNIRQKKIKSSRKIQKGNLLKGGLNNSSWDVSNVTNMSQMFYRATNFNQDIGNWDISNVTEMSFMFYEASSFDQDLSGWCVTSIVSEPDYFSTGSPLSDVNKPIWGTCPDTSLGVNDQDVTNILIYPNPVLDKLFIKGVSDATKVSIYNILGKLVVSKTTSNAIDVGNLQSGMYIVKIVDEQKEIIKKFIKK